MGDIDARFAVLKARVRELEIEVADLKKKQEIPELPDICQCQACRQQRRGYIQ